jgi:hypothetical protein
MLYDTSLTLHQTYFGDMEEAETTLAKVKTTVDIFDEHAVHEDRFVYLRSRSMNRHWLMPLNRNMKLIVLCQKD